MRETTLCYIEKDNSYLLLHRIKKKNDVNKNKWIGIGGGLEAGESPEACLRREVMEETGLTLTDYRACGRIYFECPPYQPEVMHLYHAVGFSGELNDSCPEGVLAWVKKSDYLSLPMWEGDKIFLSLMEAMVPYFELSLIYSGDTLREAILNGEPLPLS